MGPYQRPEDRFLEGRELPKELIEKFTAWSISRQEQDTFRDRLWATCPTKAEIDSVAAAKNPWAELGKLEDRPPPPRKDRHHTVSEIDSREGEEAEGTSTAAEEEPALAPLAKATLPKRPSSNPYADRLRDMSDEDLLEFHDRFIKIYHLDSQFAVPEAILKDNNLAIYQALTAEVRYRKRGE